MYLRCGSGPISFLISGYFSVGKNKGIMYCAISISHASIIHQYMNYTHVVFIEQTLKLEDYNYYSLILINYSLV